MVPTEFSEHIECDALAFTAVIYCDFDKMWRQHKLWIRRKFGVESGHNRCSIIFDMTSISCDQNQSMSLTILLPLWVHMELEPMVFLEQMSLIYSIKQTISENTEC